MLESMTISIDEMGNASMEDNSREEVINILQGIIKTVENYGVLNCDGMRLRDINGNSIGSVSVVENNELEEDES